MSDNKKKRELTDMQKAFLKALAGEAKGDIRAAMRIAGYADSVGFRDVVPSLIDEIKEVAENLLAANAIKAVMGITGVLDDPSAVGAKNAVSAAKELLDRVGIHKKEQGPTEIKADNIFILPAKDTPIDNEDKSE